MRKLPVFRVRYAWGIQVCHAVLSSVIQAIKFYKAAVFMSIAGKDRGQEEKRTTEDELAGWHHRLNGHGFGWTLGVGDGQGGLACCGSWGRKETRLSDGTELIQVCESISQGDLTWSKCSGKDSLREGT